MPRPRWSGRSDGLPPLTERARAIRGLLKDLGIKGVSVTAPSYSMAQAVHVRIPELGCNHPSWEDRAACTGCQMRNRAVKRIETLIVQAFPNLDNRSDSMTDYFDYCVSVR